MLKSKIKPMDSSCSAKEVFGLRALGDSMLPEFADGVLLVIDPEAPVRDGSFVVATVNGDYIMRQLRIIDDKYYLRPLNDLYETVQIRGLEDIVGKVIQQGSRRRNLKRYD